MQGRENSMHTEVIGSHLYRLPRYDLCITYSYLIPEFNRSQA